MRRFSAALDLAVLPLTSLARVIGTKTAINRRWGRWGERPREPLRLPDIPAREDARPAQQADSLSPSGGEGAHPI